MFQSPSPSSFSPSLHRYHLYIYIYICNCLVLSCSVFPFTCSVDQHAGRNSTNRINFTELVSHLSVLRVPCPSEREENARGAHITHAPSANDLAAVDQPIRPALPPPTRFKLIHSLSAVLIPSLRSERKRERGGGREGGGDYDH